MSEYSSSGLLGILHQFLSRPRSQEILILIVLCTCFVIGVSFCLSHRSEKQKEHEKKEKKRKEEEEVAQKKKKAQEKEEQRKKNKAKKAPVREVGPITFLSYT